MEDEQSEIRTHHQLYCTILLTFQRMPQAHEMRHIDDINYFSAIEDIMVPQA